MGDGLLTAFKRNNFIFAYYCMITLWMRMIIL
jgi:hypothetical protein